MSASVFRNTLLAILLVGAAVMGWLRFEGSPPVVEAPAALLIGAGGRTVALELADVGTGLRRLSVVLDHAEGEQTLLDEEYPGSWLTGAAAREARRVELHVDPRRMKVPRGEAFLRVSVRDWSWRGGFQGNETQLDVPLEFDLDPPRITVATGLTYVYRGGAGTVVYSVSEPTIRSGVRVGDDFYRGFPVDGRRVAFYAVPTDAIAQPAIRVVAEDAAGNPAEARWAVVMKERGLPDANVTLPQRFLEQRVAPLARAQNVDGSDLAVAFREINETLRAANEARIRELVADSAPERLWEGPFLQLPNSKVTARFGERRRYFVDGQALSKATHFGYDLASTRAAPIPAANSGRVIFAADLGIYGDCVLVDHGLGLTSLYAHLSRLDVAVGDRVKKGQTLGLSGATGLAGGDHLHFAILVGNTYVDPLEWWDPKWVHSNVDARIASAAP